MPLVSLRDRRRGPTAAGRLAAFDQPFVNPGALAMRCHVSATLPPGAPLVVVLHGCTQNAAGYDRGAGWSALAERLGFALLFPEQVRANNANGCFNWFEPGDTRRGAGEAASIAAATRAMTAHYRLDASRVFVTGLSAGGAMASVMLATYPDVFAGGAIVAGLPFGIAHSVGEAMATMASPTPLAPAQLGERVRQASTYPGPWPIVSVWHGSADRTVAAGNGRAVAAQWAAVHDAASSEGTTWRNAAGVTVVELNEVAGMGHGTPIDSADGGTPAPFMIDVGIASSARIASFWGLDSAVVAARPGADARPSPPRGLREPVSIPRQQPVTAGPGVLINSVLRAAGLLK